MSDGYVTIKGRRYPSRYCPGNGYEDLDEAWKIIDSVKDGVIPDDVRAYLAGQITGVLARIRLQEQRKYSLPFAQRVPKVLNKRTDLIPPDAVYVGRPSKWENPFVIGKDGTREDCIRRWAATLEDHDREQIRHELRGKDLVCWCAPLPCHADLLLKIANAEDDAP